MPAKLPDTCWVITDKNHIIQRASDSWYELWGFAAHEAVGKPVTIINRPGMRSPVARRRYESNQVTTTRCSNVTKLGAIIAHDLSLETHADGILGTSKNIELVKPAPTVQHLSARDMEYYGDAEAEEESLDVYVPIRRSGRDMEWDEEPGATLREKPASAFDVLFIEALKKSLRSVPLVRRPSGRDAEYYEDASPTVEAITGKSTARRSGRDAEFDDEPTLAHRPSGRDAEYFEGVVPTITATVANQVRRSGRDAEFDDEPSPSTFARRPSGRDAEFYEGEAHSTSATDSKQARRSGRDAEFDGEPTLARRPSGRDAEYFEGVVPTITANVANQVRRSGRDAEFDEETAPVFARRPSGRDAEYDGVAATIHPAVASKARPSGRDAEFDEEPTTTGTPKKSSAAKSPAATPPKTWAANTGVKQLPKHEKKESGCVIF